MKVLFFLYDGCAEFEITFIGMGVHSAKQDVVTCTHLPDLRPIVAESGFRFWPDLKLPEVNVEEYDMLLFPGGRPEYLLQEASVLELIREFRRQEKWVGAICAGPAFLAAAGILDGVRFTTSLTEEVEGFQGLFDWSNYVEEDVVVDGKVITGKGNGYVEFAATVLRQLQILTNEADAEEFLDYFKNRKPESLQA